MKTQPVLLIHGGAWAMPDDAVAAHENGIANALVREGREMLPLIPPRGSVAASVQAIQSAMPTPSGPASGSGRIGSRSASGIGAVLNTTAPGGLWAGASKPNIST